MNKREKKIVESFLDIEEMSYEDAINTLKYIIIYILKAEKATADVIKKMHKRFATNGVLSADDVKQLLNKKELAEFKKKLNKYLDELEYYEYIEYHGIDAGYIDELKRLSKAKKITRMQVIDIYIKNIYYVTYSKICSMITGMLVNGFTNTFYRSAYEIQKYQCKWFNIDKINKSMLLGLIYIPWSNDNKNIKDRLNAVQMAQILDVQNTILKSVVYERPIECTMKKLSNISDKTRSKLGRLVRTEQSYYTSLALHKTYERLGIKEYQIIAVLDNRTSFICRHLNGKRFKIKDFSVGITAPPFHPNCRSTTRPCVYRKIYKDVKEYSFDEWKKKYLK